MTSNYSLTFNSGFSQSLARELTTKCEGYRNYPTASICHRLENSSQRVADLENLLEESREQSESEEVLTIAYVYADKIKSYVEENLLLAEDRLLSPNRQLGSLEACEFTAHAAAFYLGLVDWTQIAVRLIAEYEIDQGINLLNNEERTRW